MGVKLFLKRILPEVTTLDRWNGLRIGILLQVLIIFKIIVS